LIQINFRRDLDQELAEHAAGQLADQRGGRQQSRRPKVSTSQIRRQIGKYGALGAEKAFSPESPTPLGMSHAPLKLAASMRVNLPRPARSPVR
jgi:hypothetical protein